MCCDCIRKLNSDNLVDLHNCDCDCLGKVKCPHSRGFFSDFKKPQHWRYYTVPLENDYHNENRRSARLLSSLSRPLVDLYEALNRPY